MQAPCNDILLGKRARFLFATPDLYSNQMVYNSSNIILSSDGFPLIKLHTKKTDFRIKVD